VTRAVRWLTSNDSDAYPRTAALAKLDATE